MAIKIILADDNKTYIMYAGLLLKRFGFQVIPCESGLEALKYCKLSGVDLIMLDVHMHTMDGISALRLIKDDTQLSHLPVIMVSTDASTETVEQCRKFGCSDYLFKPLEINRLYASLQECLYGPRGTKRQSFRASVTKKAIVDYQGRKHELYSDNLSAEGVFLRNEDPFPEGSEVELTLYLDDNSAITTRGEVMFVSRPNQDVQTTVPGMAIRFKNPPQSHTMMISNYIRNHLASDILEKQVTQVIAQ